jgi:hypothetical protein
MYPCEMSRIHRKSVTSAIDASADTDRWVAIRYVDMDGDMKDMLVRKTISVKKTDASPGAKGNYMIRDKGLIRVIDRRDNVPKSLFIYAITHANLDGDLTKMIRVAHEQLNLS